MKLGLGLLAVCLFSLVPKVAGAASIVVNGDFESPALGQPPFSGTTVTGWTLTPETNLETNADYVGIGATGNTGTGQFIAFGGGDFPGGTLSQTLPTVAGTTYNLFLSYGAFGGPQILRIDVAGAFGLISDLTGPTDLSQVFGGYAFQFVALGNDTLVFSDASLSSVSADGFLDDVRVEAVTQAAVPEPATLALLGLGLTGLVRVQRFRAGRRQ